MPICLKYMVYCISLNMVNEELLAQLCEVEVFLVKIKKNIFVQTKKI